MTDTPALANLRVDLDAKTLYLRIDRPEKRNALDSTTRAALMDGLDWAAGTPDVRVVVITGTGGKAFASGADLSERPDPSERADRSGRRVYDAVAECPRPVIVMIDGYCLGGGCELALSTDLRVASTRSTFGQPEIRLGIIPGGGATQRLPRLIGLGQTMRLVATGDRIDAVEAHRLGIVDVLVDADELERTVRDLCASIARHSPVALGLAKQAVRASLELPLAEGLALELELLDRALASDDGQEGIAAFLDKREPRFRGS